MLCTTGLSGSAPSLRMRMSVSCLHSVASASGVSAPSGIVTSSSGIWGWPPEWVAFCNLLELDAADNAVARVGDLAGLVGGRLALDLPRPAAAAEEVGLRRGRPAAHVVR